MPARRSRRCPGRSITAQSQARESQALQAACAWVFTPFVGGEVTFSGLAAEDSAVASDRIQCRRMRQGGNPYALRESQLRVLAARYARVVRSPCPLSEER